MKLVSLGAALTAKADDIIARAAAIAASFTTAHEVGGVAVLF